MGSAVRESTTGLSPEHIGALGDSAVEVEIVERSVEAPGIVSLRLRAHGGPLPEWRRGCHIDVATPFGSRQYSLCGDRDEIGDWRIAVLDEPAGSGGSRWLHEHALPSSSLWVGMPRDTFGYRGGGETLLIAGGVGILTISPTPLAPYGPVDTGCSTTMDLISGVRAMPGMR